MYRISLVNLARAYSSWSVESQSQEFYSPCLTLIGNASSIRFAFGKIRVRRTNGENENGENENSEIAACLTRRRMDSGKRGRGKSSYIVYRDFTYPPNIFCIFDCSSFFRFALFILENTNLKYDLVFNLIEFASYLDCINVEISIIIRILGML